jgi:hypothetical protein
MAEAKTQAASEQLEDDWEEVEPSHPDDTISILSESETIANDQTYIEIDHPKKTYYPGRLYRDPREDPQGPLPTLRKSLYTLEDTLKESIEQLNDFAQNASMQALALSEPIAHAQQKQVDALNMLLTNCASDWETFARQGGMTFDEFADLDPVSVDELCKIFRDFVEEVRGQKYGRGSENVENCEDGEADVGFLDFILPAIDEVDKLLRIQPQDMEGSKTHKESDQDAETVVTKNEKEEQSHETDDRVHEKMMMVSDW